MGCMTQADGVWMNSAIKLAERGQHAEGEECGSAVFKTSKMAPLQAGPSE